MERKKRLKMPPPKDHREKVNKIHPIKPLYEMMLVADDVLETGGMAVDEKGDPRWWLDTDANSLTGYAVVTDSGERYVYDWDIRHVFMGLKIVITDKKGRVSISSHAMRKAEDKPKEFDPSQLKPVITRAMLRRESD